MFAGAAEITRSTGPVFEDFGPVIDGVEGGQQLAIDERAPLSATETGSVVGRILASEFDGEEIVFFCTFFSVDMRRSSPKLWSAEERCCGLGVLDT